MSRKAATVVLAILFLSSCNLLEQLFGPSPGTTYSVTYNGNGNTGGAMPVDKTAYKPGASVSVLGNTGSLVRSGYTFVGWNTQTDGRGTGYTQGQTFIMGNADVTLYAQWSALAAYTVTYVGNGSSGGSPPTDTTNYLEGQTVTVLGNSGNLTKTGHSFTGWNTASDGSGATYTQGQTFTTGTSEVRLYALWVAGTARWARTATAGPTGTVGSPYISVAVDSSGNVYAVGAQQGPETYTYGPGVSASGTYSNENVLLVKYDASGVAQWARTVSTGSTSSRFDGVAVDSSANVYVAGYQTGSGTYVYGTGVTASGTNSPGNNVVLVKYDP